MKAVLAAEIGDQVVVTVTMSKEELAQAGTAPVFLAAAVCEACSGVLTEVAGRKSSDSGDSSGRARCVRIFRG